MKIVLFIISAVFFVSCSFAPASSSNANSRKLNTEAMERMQGVWQDAETDAVAFRMKGDSIFYTDSIDMPTRFAVYDDTLVVFGASEVHYTIVRLGDYVFDCETLMGDTLHLVRSEEMEDTLLFQDQRNIPIQLNQVVKRDTVLFADSHRYHLYINVNPTRRSVEHTSYTDEGLAVNQVYYDNIIHITVYEGRLRLFSRNLNKTDFSEVIPADFLTDAILSDMQFGHADHHGCRFLATICEPEGARCYVVCILVSPKGKMKLELTEY